METELKELEKRVSRLEEITGNTYNVYMTKKSVRLPIELVKLVFSNTDTALENIKLHEELRKEKLKNKQLEELATNLLLKLNNKEVEII